MAEQVWERTHDPTASVASEQSTIGHCNDGDQTQRPGHHQEPPEYAREIPPTHGCAEKDGTGVSGLGPSARQGTTHGRTFRPHHRVAVGRGSGSPQPVAIGVVTGAPKMAPGAGRIYDF